jgi:hypothetical protein
MNNYQPIPFNVFDRDNFQRVSQVIKTGQQALRRGIRLSHVYVRFAVSPYP